MPTIYDLLPELEKRVIQLLEELLKADDNQFHLWEMAVFLPASNAFLHYLDGVNLSLKGDNYVAATANLRGLIECLGAVVYDGVAKLPESAYQKFLKKGRLPKWDDEAKEWKDLGPRESVEYAQMAVDEKLKLKTIYDDCCDLLHFSTAHMNFLGGFDPKPNEKDRTIKIKIGTKDHIPVELQRQTIDICAELTTGLGRMIRLAIDEKQRIHKARTKK